MPETKDIVQRCAETHTTLCIFGAVRNVLEGGSVFGRHSQTSADRIIEICEREIAILNIEFEQLKERL